MSNVVSWCSIKNNKILKDGKTVAEFSGLSFDDFLLKAYDHFALNYPKFYKMDRQSKLGVLATEILLNGMSEVHRGSQTAVVLSNASASLDTDLRFWESAKTQASPSLFVYTLANIVAGEICIKNGFKGESIFFVSPQFNPSWTASYVDMILTSQKTSTCLAGWVDVLAEDGEVFLYLADNSNVAGQTHTGEKIAELYQSWKN
jgi:hypothetical protein